MIFILLFNKTLLTYTNIRIVCIDCTQNTTVLIKKKKLDKRKRLPYRIEKIIFFY